MTYTIKPHISAESSGAMEEGCFSYSIAIERPGERPHFVGEFADGDALALAVERASSEPAYLVELLLASVALRQHHHDASRRDWAANAQALRKRLAEAEPAASDLGGRVFAAAAALHEAGHQLAVGEGAAAWVAVLRAAEALDRPGGLGIEAAALRAAEHLERWLASAEDIDRRAGVVSASWDERAGCWYVECRASGLASLWGVCVTAEGAEVVDET